MVCGDFLRKKASTPFCRHFSAAGVVVALSTNSEAILQSAERCFQPVETPAQPPDLSLRFYVDGVPHRPAYWRKPFFRAMEHLAYAGFGPESALVINLRAKRGFGRFSPEVAGDQSFWKRVIFPVVLSIACPSLGIAVIHSACVARGGEGLLLAGPSGSGKSTLSLALTNFGFEFLADDRSFISLQSGRLEAWRVPMALKIRAEALGYFNGLEGGRPGTGSRGEDVLEFDPDAVFPPGRAISCRPRWLVFLDRQSGPCFKLGKMSPEEASVRLEKDMLAESHSEAEFQREVIRRLTQGSVRQLTYGGSPQAVAEELARACAQL
jgi:hypothetical protein